MSQLSSINRLAALVLRVRISLMCLALAALAATPAVAGPAGAWPETRDRAPARLAFHLARAEALQRALAHAVLGPCKRFPSRDAWDAWLAARVDDGVTVAAHLQEAWRVAKRSGDPGLRAQVKAARRRLVPGNPLGLVRKLTGCAWTNGSVLDAWGVWRRAAAEFPRRRAAVAGEADAAGL